MPTRKRKDSKSTKKLEKVALNQCISAISERENWKEDQLEEEGQIIDLLATYKSRCFAQPCPMFVKYLLSE